MKGALKIGQVAKACGVTPDTVRYYEREGLLPAPGRTSSSHRVYDEESIRRLQFIRGAQELGLTLSDIRALIALRSLPEPERCQKVVRRLRERLEDHERKIEALRAERARLRRSIERCERGRPEECSVLAPLVRPTTGGRRR